VTQRASSSCLVTWCVAFTVGLLIATPCLAQRKPAAPPLWATLVPGRYGVGFRVLYRLDRSRVWETGDSAIDKDPARPIRVSVWYPASADGSGQAMSYRDYVLFGSPGGPFTRLNVLLETRDTLSQRGAFAGAEGFRPRLNSLPVFARRGAQRASGKFPLVLYSAGWNSSTQHDNSVLAEYLASHGYVVAAVPQVGPSASTFGLRVSPADLEIQMRDIEFAMGVVHELREVERSSLAAPGRSPRRYLALRVGTRRVSHARRAVPEAAEAEIMLLHQHLQHAPPAGATPRCRLFPTPARSDQFGSILAIVVLRHPDQRAHPRMNAAHEPVDSNR